MISNCLKKNYLVVYITIIMPLSYPRSTELSREFVGRLYAVILNFLSQSNPNSNDNLNSNIILKK